MRVHLLGTAAGGGFPQWNCNCLNCTGVRSGRFLAQPRTQSCVAVSFDEQRWFLLNASPDVRFQIESFPPLQPQNEIRETGIEGVLLTNADLDHTLGLFVLREGRPLVVHATPAVQESLTDRLTLSRVLSAYCGIRWQAPPIELSELKYSDGSPSGLSYKALLIEGNPPRYGSGGSSTSTCHSIGYCFLDETTGGRLVFLPDLAGLDSGTMRELSECDAILIDGTFWSEEEMREAGVGTTSASAMGHLPIGGPQGSLARIASLKAARKIYVHINNTNPILLEDSSERRAVEQAGVTVGEDGIDFRL